jgi:heat shock protein HtpX
MGRRAELFPRDWPLTVQMVAIAVLTPLVGLAVIVGGFIVVSTIQRIMIVLGLVIGAAVMIRDWRRRPSVRLATEADAPELIALVNRLCAVADVARPDVVVVASRRPNSWLIQVPRRTPRLHITTGLLALLEPDELAAVVAHELSHVANGDAALMTVVGMPGMLAARSGGMVLPFVALLSTIATNALSRRRELAADRGACAITGRPSALASALLKVSDGIAVGPKADLRKVALADSFHLLPMRQPKRRVPLLGRLGQTHPPLKRRLQALEGLEHHLQHARRAL